MTEFFDTLAANPGLFIGVCAALGLMIGSFLNVIIHRVPIMMDHALRAECAELSGGAATPAPAYNLVTPRSACPKCQARDIGWVQSKGRGTLHSFEIGHQSFNKAFKVPAVSAFAVSMAAF